MLKPATSGRMPAGPKDELIDAMQARDRRSPGNNYEFTQPIQLRFNELIAGVRSDVAVKVFGDDMDVLHETAARSRPSWEGAGRGGRQGRADHGPAGARPCTIDARTIARYGLNVADVQEMVEAAIGGQVAGNMFEGDRRFDIVVRLPELSRSIWRPSKRLPIPLPASRAAEALADDSSPRRPPASAYIPSARWPSSHFSRAPTRSAGRTASGASWSAPMCGAATSAPLVAEAQAKSESEVQVPPGIGSSWGGHSST